MTDPIKPPDEDPGPAPDEDRRPDPDEDPDPEPRPGIRPPLPSRRRTLISLAVVVALLAPLTWWWVDSFVPRTYNVMEMGFVDYGGGPGGSGHHTMIGPGGRPVDTLVAPPGRPADVTVTLTARNEPFSLASGRKVDGYTLNGTSPGPTIEAVQGQLVEVRLVNESVPDGTTLHWHGVDVPNAMDGVAGVTQNAVGIGETFVYRFIATDAGTYWYHSHQVSHAQVIGGLFGALVVHPSAPTESQVDEPVLIHTYAGRQTLNGADGDIRIAAASGAKARIRLINTDNGPTPVWVDGAGYRLLAVDSTDLHEPGLVTGEQVLLTAGGRFDLEVTAPADGSAVRITVGGAAGVLVGSGTAPAASAQPATTLDQLAYGTPDPAAARPDPAQATRRFAYDMDRRWGFVDGRPGLWWTINGRLFPDVPMYVVTEGDIVVMTISNDSGEVHPMHLHGHHALVVSRNGVPASGSPWWIDSLNVKDGESYDVIFRADNPGIWMDHCHNLHHAEEGLVAHLAYTGISEPFRVGGDAGNEPE